MATESIFHNIVIDAPKKQRHSLPSLNKLPKQQKIALSATLHLKM